MRTCITRQITKQHSFAKRPRAKPIMPQRRTRFMLYICCLVWFLLPMHSIYGGARTLDNTQREISPNLCVFAVAASNFGCCALCLNYARCYLCAANFVRRRRGSLNGLSACAASMMFFFVYFYAPFRLVDWADAEQMENKTHTVAGYVIALVIQLKTRVYH